MFPDGNLVMTLSNVVEFPRSPFSYQLREKLIKSAIPGARVVSASNVYAPDVHGISESDDALYVVAVSEKDPERYQRLIQGSYFLPYHPDDMELLPACRHGYVVRVPTYGNNEDSTCPLNATQLRAKLMSSQGAWREFVDEMPCDNSIKLYNQMIAELAMRQDSCYSVCDHNVNDGTVASGHIMHPYEDHQISFCDIVDMFHSVVSDDRKMRLQEKVDGQNIKVTRNCDGEVRFACNLTHRKNGAKNAMSRDDVIERYSKYQDPNVLETFKNAFDAFELFMEDFSYIDMKQGTRFWNAEIVNPDNKNVVKYHDKYIVLHGLMGCDQDGREVNYFSYDPGMYGCYNGFNFVGPIEVGLHSEALLFFKESTMSLNNFFANFTVPDAANGISFLEALNVLDDNKNDDVPIHHHIREEFLNEIAQFASSNQHVLSMEQAIGLTQRFAYNQKSGVTGCNLRKMRSMFDDDAFLEKCISRFQNGFDSKYVNKVRHFVEHIGTAIKKRVFNTLNDGTDTTGIDVSEIEKMNRVVSKRGHDDMCVHVGNDIPKFEGIVFTYNDKTYKITGMFRRINYLLGCIKYGRI